MNEQEYIDDAPTLGTDDPELWNLKKMKTLRFEKDFRDQSVLFVHYQYEGDYNHILTKLVSLVPVMPATLKLLIVGMPENATKLDTSIAQRFQQMMKGKHRQPTLVLFVQNPDKIALLEEIFTGRGSDHRLLDGLKLKKAELAADVLLYSWGCARNGKLGLTDNYMGEYDSDNLPEFYQRNDLSTAVDDYRESGILPKGFTVDPTLSPQQVEDLLDFDQRSLFTIRPQPIVSLLGKTFSQICLGKEHCIAVTEEGEMYAWGSNSRGQLGIPVKSTEKTVDFVSFGHEAPQDDDDAGVPDGRSQSAQSASQAQSEDIAMRPLVQVTKTITASYVGVP